MVGLTLSQAAKTLNKSKSTLNRAIKDGRLSAIRNEDGTFSIDPAELYRAFPIPSKNALPERPLERSRTPDLTEFHSRISMLEQLLEKERETSAREREIAADLQEDRDKWRQQATGLLSDLRTLKKVNSEFSSEENKPIEKISNFAQIPPRPWLWRIIKRKTQN